MIFFFIEEVSDNLILSVPIKTVGDLITFKKKPAFSNFFFIFKHFFSSFIIIGTICDSVFPVSMFKEFNFF